MPKLPIGDIGPCEVTWDYEGTNLIITPYLGKVSLRMADAVTDVHIDGQGVAPIESFFEGTTVELEVPMARSRLDQLAETIGYASMGVPAANGLILLNVAGIEMSGNAKPIVIKPVCNGVPDAAKRTWTLLHKCHPYRDFELGWDRSGQRVHMVKFKVLATAKGGGGGVYDGYDYFHEGVTPSPPAPPTLLTATKARPPFAHMEIDLTWEDNSEDEDGFKIERRLTDGGVFSQIDIAPADATTYASTGLSPNTWYSYQIRAYNAYGDSAYSNEASAKTDAPV